MTSLCTSFCCFYTCRSISKLYCYLIHILSTITFLCKTFFWIFTNCEITLPYMHIQFPHFCLILFLYAIFFHLPLYAIPLPASPYILILHNSPFACVIFILHNFLHLSSSFLCNTIPLPACSFILHCIIHSICPFHPLNYTFLLHLPNLYNT